MQKIHTRDGSETFVNEHYNESYHSFTGAVEEATEKYCKPTKIAQLAEEKGEFTLLDFAFGMGYNSAMAIAIARGANPDCKITVIGLENDAKIVEKIQEVNPKIPGYEQYKFLTSKHLIHTCYNDTVTIQILLGDARETIKQIDDNSVDVIFYDPFSPKTQAEMWTKELFLEVKRILKPKTGVMATYSCARMPRDNMKAAGLHFDDGPKVGRRGPGTLAWK
tara:strand:+ start:610 stop:1272 length:663 start_codon:yes stop_codon:yes gene_type:complete